MSKTMKKRMAEYRAEPVKSLVEQRAALYADYQAIIEGAKAETRAISDEEAANLVALDKLITDIDRTIEAEKRAAALIEQPEATKLPESVGDEAEVRAFVGYIKQESGIAAPELRSGEQNITMSNNGAVIPTSIANRIINTVKEMCPILAGATMFAVKGTLKVPVWGNANTTHNITVGYQDEFTDITADAGAFSSVDLTGYLAGALTLIGKSVINNSEINVLDFIVNEMSRQIALFVEKELLVGTNNKATGALSTTNTLNAGSTSAISADNLIELQAKLATPFQDGACWTMAPATFTSIKKLKDASGQYLLQTAPNMVNGYPYMLLGKPVYLSDNMPSIASAAKAVLYGNYAGLGVNMRQNIEMQVLNEKYATQHAVGLVAWFEFDAKILDNQQLATLVMSV
jgi:HK97 family phage major capsid protein